MANKNNNKRKTKPPAQAAPKASGKGKATSGKRERQRAAAKQARQQQIQRYVVFAVGALIVLGVGWWGVQASQGGGSGEIAVNTFDLPALQRDDVADDVAPEPVASDFGDERFNVELIKGTPTVVNFFATWCTSCDTEMPGFQRVERALEGEVAFAGVSTMHTGGDRLNWVDKHDVLWPLGQDIKGGRGGTGFKDNVIDAFANGEVEGSGSVSKQSMPVTAFYDANGELAWVHGGALSESDLRSIISRVFDVA